MSSAGNVGWFSPERLLSLAPPQVALTTYMPLCLPAIWASIPGKPTFIVQNMQAPVAALAANWLYTAAPKDGRAMAMLGQNTAFDQALGAEGVQFDVRNFIWIGNPIVANNVMIAWQASGEAIAEVIRKQSSANPVTA